MNSKVLSGSSNQDDKYVGNSPEAKRIKRAIRKFSKVDSYILIVGDTGTGKEFIARQIHMASVKKNRPFVVLNCSALGITNDRNELFGEETEQAGTIQRTIGILEKANRGTLYLDNVADLSPEFQFELLQVFRERKFHRIGGSENIPLEVRIIAS
ncbi:MAG: sigma 54-interacting transcriptional regulator, partial [bacterium]